jgi:hypothetical protein
VKDAFPPQLYSRNDYVHRARGDCNYSSLDIERERCESRQENRAIVSGSDDNIDRVRA